ncbi:hypothetical protein Sme01_49350 [Sphaerisporangium melleum]|uniref:Uncharacterized protein n=1 Tax=Sphaerisporangium melleum TaxID=321316 RepID=A0A917R3E2_9ACTN|nr:hypothetical protein GCM10007964_33040 [Sphaerisporangium melleum]GII72459.1 hypothetical protein Sme01_49350 [Sphaerisporangium melleum]
MIDPPQKAAGIRRPHAPRPPPTGPAGVDDPDHDRAVTVVHVMAAALVSLQVNGLVTGPRVSGEGSIQK